MANDLVQSVKDTKLYVKEHLDDAREFLEHVKSLPNGGKEDLDHLSQLLIPAKEKGKKVVAWRKTKTAPIDKAKKQIMDLVRPLVSVLGEIEIVLKNKLAEGFEKLEAHEQSMVDEAADNDDLEAMAIPDTKVKGVRKRKETLWEVEDESKIPRKYKVLVVDEDAIAEAVAAGKKVPGVRVWTETRVSAGRGL